MVEPGGRSASKPPRDGAVYVRAACVIVCVYDSALSRQQRRPSPRGVDATLCRAVNATMLMCGCAKVARAWRREVCRAALLLVCCAGEATLTFRLAHVI